MARSVLDASALLAWLFDEDGATTVEAALDGSAMSTVNLAEVLYSCDDRRMATGHIAADLQGVGVSLEPMSAEDAHGVAMVRRVALDAGVRCSLADYACIALGMRMRVPVLSADRTWARIPLPVPVHVIR